MGHSMPHKRVKSWCFWLLLKYYLVFNLYRQLLIMQPIVRATCLLFSFRLSQKMTASDEDEWIDFMASIAIEFSTCIHNGENSGKQTLRSVCFPEFLCFSRIWRESSVFFASHYMAPQKTQFSGVHTHAVWSRINQLKLDILSYVCRKSFQF